MRPLPAALIIAVAVACTASERPPADTAAPGDAAMDSAASAASAAGSPGATATPVPAPAESARAARATTPTPAGAAGTRATSRTTGTTPVARGATDTSTGPRLRPPSKAPGGYIIVPNSAHDSLRMAPAPGTTTGTSTRP